jgi:hypothetical protein
MMTSSPDPSRPACPPAGSTLRAENLSRAVLYVLDGAARLIADDQQAAGAGLLQGGAEAACLTYSLSSQDDPEVFRRAAYYLAIASGYQPLETTDPVIDRALDELPAYPPERQVRLLTYASRRATPSP